MHLSDRRAAPHYLLGSQLLLHQGVTGQGTSFQVLLPVPTKWSAAALAGGSDLQELQEKIRQADPNRGNASLWRSTTHMHHCRYLGRLQVLAEVIRRWTEKISRKSARTSKVLVCPPSGILHVRPIPLPKRWHSSTTSFSYGESLTIDSFRGIIKCAWDWRAPWFFRKQIRLFIFPLHLRFTISGSFSIRRGILHSLASPF